MCDQHDRPDITRRNFAGLALAGAAASLIPMRVLAAGVESDALCIMCIDPRAVYSTIRFFDDPVLQGGLGIPGKYDMVALAGASLASVSLAFPTSIGAIWDHIALAIQLHNIQRVVVMDHSDCGAFKAAYGRDDEALHVQVMHQMKAEYVRRKLAPALQFYLMPVRDNFPPPNYLRPKRIII